MSGGRRDEGMSEKTKTFPSILPAPSFRGIQEVWRKNLYGENQQTMRTTTDEEDDTPCSIYS